MFYPGLLTRRLGVSCQWLELDWPLLEGPHCVVPSLGTELEGQEAGAPEMSSWRFQHVIVLSFSRRQPEWVSSIGMRR